MTLGEWSKAAAFATIVAGFVGAGTYYAGWRAHVSAEAVQAKTVEDDHQLLVTMAPKVEAAVTLGAVQATEIIAARREQDELRQDVRDLIASQRDLSDKMSLLIQAGQKEGRIAR